MVPSASLNPNRAGGSDSSIGPVEYVCTLYVYPHRHHPLRLSLDGEGEREIENIRSLLYPGSRRVISVQLRGDGFNQTLRS